MPAPVRMRWLDSYIEQTRTRDIETLDGRRDPVRLRAYLEALALNTAGVVTDKTLYDAAAVNARTGEAYERLPHDLLIVDKVPAWLSNRLKRLVRGPRRYLVDPALVAALLRVDGRALIRDGDLLGRLPDTFVRWLRDELGDRFVAGVVLHTGPRASTSWTRGSSPPPSASCGSETRTGRESRVLGWSSDRRRPGPA
ncbi:DUF4143 domain-containing protein [Microbispora sp. ZYX-F-249]|uniref:DUF4143 domain-containing protein n=1 Tax=Microbispora maris TaxID=3144104 RepID=A0ABV0AQM5_9ACTN